MIDFYCLIQKSKKIKPTNEISKNCYVHIWIPLKSQAEVTSDRTNLSPFTKDHRGAASWMLLTYFLAPYGEHFVNSIASYNGDPFWHMFLSWHFQLSFDYGPPLVFYCKQYSENKRAIIGIFWRKKIFKTIPQMLYPIQAQMRFCENWSKKMVLRMG